MTGHPEDAKIRFFTGTYQLFPAELLAARPVVELDLGCGAVIRSAPFWPPT